MQIQDLHTLFLETTGVTTDTRKITEGCLFFALKGDNFDGNDYATKAITLGAKYAIVDNESLASAEGCIYFKSSLSCLQSLANFHRNYLKTPIIGITGSNGKTTTKELLATALEPKFNLYYTQGNFNNHIGVPLTLLALKEEHEIAVIEMGANHPYEIEELCKICEPQFGIITNIGKAHLEGFGGLEGVIKTKKELYDYIEGTGGKLFVNAQDELLISLSQSIDRILYNNKDSAYKISLNSALPTLKLNISHQGKKSILETQLVGEYNLINIAAALEIGDSQGVPYDKMKRALESYTPNNNRSQIIKTKKNTVILDAYNANPASMEVAIDNFSKLKQSPKIALLGAMKELGKYSESEHRALAEKVSTTQLDFVALVGNEFKNTPLSGNMLFFETANDLKLYLNKNYIIASTVLIKGSRSMKMENLLDSL